MTQPVGVLLSRGDVWTADLDPVRGHAQGGERPCVLVSADFFNRSRSRLVVLLPITTRDRRLPLHVLIHPPEGGLRRPSFVMCDQVRTVAGERLRRQLGSLSSATMDTVDRRIRRLLRL